MTETPKISIIVPVYNVAEFLPNCINSLVNQTFKNIEIICINDGSIDNSLDILKSYADKFDIIKIIDKKNEGLSAARNTGINIANGDYISFVDSDDWIELNFIEKLYNAAINNNADIATTNIIKKKKGITKHKIFYADEKIYDNIQDKLTVCDIPKQCYVWNKLYKRSFLETNRINFFEGANFEDIRFTIRALYYSKTLVTVPNTAYFYRLRSNSIVKTLSSQNIIDKGNSLNDMFAFADAHGIIFSDNDRCFTVKKYTLFSDKINLLKIKQCIGEYRYYLFGFLLIWRRKFPLKLH